MVCLSKQHDFRYEERVQEKSAIWLKFRYQRDPIGNRLTSTTAESGSPVIRNYTSNNLNQYTAIDSPAASPAYDFDGNTVVCPLSSGLWSLSWNAENRLKEMEKSDAKLDFLYDHMGRRSQKRVYSGSPGAWSLVTDALFVYDGYKLIEELDGQNSDAILRKYVWSGETPFSMTDADGTFYYVLDANKNVSELIDSTGVVRAHYEYSPYGEITVMTGDKAYENPIRFSSEYFDVETGLVYYNFRYYSPELGRWMSRDPIGEEGGENLYAMTFNDTLNRYDELGQRSWWDNESFIKWLLDSQNTPQMLSWDYFDPDGTDRDTLASRWRVENIKAFVDLCDNSPFGEGEYSINTKTVVVDPLVSETHAWISSWIGKVYTNYAVTLDKNPDTCVCTFKVGLNYQANDKADFNPGETFGPEFRNGKGIMKDDWFIWLKNNTIFGHDYEMWAEDYSTITFEIRFGEECTNGE